MLATIENSKKNKELLQKVLKDSKNMDSTVLFETFANNLNPTKGSFRSNPKWFLIFFMVLIHGIKQEMI